VTFAVITGPGFGEGRMILLGIQDALTPRETISRSGGHN